MILDNPYIMKCKNFDMNSLKEFHSSNISVGNRVVMVLGSKNDLDLKY